jgi:RND family efflux transporter MFP subunit
MTVVVVCAVVGCSKKQEPEPTVSVQAAVVKQVPLDRTVSAEAILFPLHQSSVASKISAPISKFLVNRGSNVHRGQLLAILENRDLQGAAIADQGTYEQAQADYSTATKSSLPEEMQKAEADVAAAKKALDAQEKIFTSREELYKQGALPRKELDQSQVDLTKARNDYELANRHLIALKKGVQQDKVKAAQGQLTAARGKYQSSAATLSYSEIRSPIDGVVTDRPLFPGDTATGGEPIVTVMDLSQIIAKAHVPQETAELLKAGDNASINVEGLDEPVQAKLTLVSPALDPNSTTVEVWVQAANPDQQLRPGATAQVSITAQTVHDAVVVPAAALLNPKEDSAQVMVVDEQSHAQSRDVKIGIKTGDQVQIVSGLKPGEMVITEGAYGLPDKTKVKIEKPESASGEAGPDKDKDNKARPESNSDDKAKSKPDAGKKDKGGKG